MTHAQFKPLDFGDGEPVFIDFSVEQLRDYEATIGDILRSVAQELASPFPCTVLPGYSEQLGKTPLPVYRFAVDIDVKLTEELVGGVAEFFRRIDGWARDCLEWLTPRFGLAEHQRVALVNGKPFVKVKDDFVKYSAHIRFPFVVLPCAWHARLGRWIQRSVPAEFYKKWPLVDADEPFVDTSPLAQAHLRLPLMCYSGRPCDVWDVHWPLMEIWSGRDTILTVGDGVVTLHTATFGAIGAAAARWLEATRLPGSDADKWFNWSIFPRKDQLQLKYPRAYADWLNDEPTAHYVWPSPLAAQLVPAADACYAYDRGFWTASGYRYHATEHANGMASWSVYDPSGVFVDSVPVTRGSRANFARVRHEELLCMVR